jgi:hypothetical protein
MVRILLLVVAFLPFTFAVRGRNYDLQEVIAHRNLRMEMESFGGAAGGAAKAKGNGGGSSNGNSNGGGQSASSSCDDSCGADSCDLPGNQVGVKACLTTSDFCVKADKWTKACRIGFACGFCNETVATTPETPEDRCDSNCTGTCNRDGGTVEICSVVANDTICVADQEAWQDICSVSEVSCGACGAEASTIPLEEESDDEEDSDDDDDDGDCVGNSTLVSVNETVSDTCNLADAEAKFVFGGNGADDKKTGMCGEVYELCNSNPRPCGSQNVTNIGASGGIFKLNCNTIVKGNNGVPRRNFLNACCNSSTDDEGGDSDGLDAGEDGGDSDGNGDGQSNGSSNGNGNGSSNGNGNGNSNGNGNGSSNGNAR